MTETPPRTIRHPQLQQESPRPVPPVQPALEDCCRSGCTPCVFDLYEDDMERYRARLKAWEARRAAGSSPLPVLDNPPAAVARATRPRLR